MKARQKMLVRILAGTGVSLVLASAVWRFGGPAMVREPAASLPLHPLHASADAGREQLGDNASKAAAAESPNPSFLRDLAAARQPIQSELNVLERERKLASLAGGMTITNLADSVDFLDGWSGSATNRDLKLRLVRRWAENDPRAAADWVSQKATGDSRQEAINSVAIVWANRNLSEAVEWLRRLPADEERQGGLIKVAYEVARSQPIEALKLAIDWPASEARDDLIEHTAKQWASSAPEAAAEWAAQIPDAALRERALAGIATAWGAKDPVAAADLAVTSLAPGRQQDDAVVGIVQRWVQSKPEEAAAWVVGFPAGSLRDAAVGNLVSLWADQDVGQAGKWVSTLAAGDTHDVAVASYVNKLTLLAPDLAAEWAAEISDATLRQRQLEAVGEQWMASDAAAARVWLAQSALPETTKARLLALPQRAP